MPTNTTEAGLETLIVRHMTGTDGLAVAPGTVAEKPDFSGAGYFAGSPKDYDRAYAVDAIQLFAFLKATQPEALKKLAMTDAANDINRLKFLTRLSAEIGKRGVVDVLRKGLEHGPVHFDLFYGTPSAAMPRPWLDTPRTDSPSRGNLPTAWKRRAGRLTSVCLSTVFL